MKKFSIWTDTELELGDGVEIGYTAIVNDETDLVEGIAFSYIRGTEYSFELEEYILVFLNDDINVIYENAKKL